MKINKKATVAGIVVGALLCVFAYKQLTESVCERVDVRAFTSELAHVNISGDLLCQSKWSKYSHLSVVTDLHKLYLQAVIVDVVLRHTLKYTYNNRSLVADEINTFIHNDLLSLGYNVESKVSAESFQFPPEVERMIQESEKVERRQKKASI